ncbi:mesoderm induction early response protein 2 isoform X1 [Oncorhynchus mykiss]|uniref:mesoderm induction early response protein 2 isoform X1 n=1 Tax=Oncorhynchus mykiss TaxID=8022 RepID=UPI001878FD42|nr:mesoderm induction early response protein 2 isoform X1 [Oncorhynchus mykiss]XP_036824916.1 mesoderm induction early response protein 2 isoform X1 [Oncorhynchus mykiss]
MGSGDHRRSLVEILRQGYEKSRTLVELQNSLGASQSQGRPMKMAVRPQNGSEIPLEDLLSLCGYEVSDPLLQQDREPNELAASLPDMTLDKDQIAKDLFSGEDEEELSADDLTLSVTSHASDLLFRRHLRAHSMADGDKGTFVSSSEDVSDDDDDNTSIPSNDERKDIMVGSMYQAKIPPLSPYSYQERVYENEDQLLWTPDMLPGQAVKEFLLSAQRRGGQDGAVDTLINGDIIKDNEQALYELVKCSFNAEEALRRMRFNVKVFSEELCAWSEEECRNFEHGYRVHGKNFHLIQANKVRTRSVGECVEYYYMWKKSDRHEYFTQQTTKLGRKKYNLQSGSMEDGEQDGEVGEMEGCSQIQLPSHPPVIDLDKQGGGPSPSQTNAPLSLKALSSLHTGHSNQAGPQDAEMGMEVLELCGAPCPSPLREQLFSHFSPLPPLEDLQQEPSLNFSSPGHSPTSPHAQLHLSSLPCCSSPCPPAEPPLLGSGFYQLQLGPFLPDGLSMGPEDGDSQGLQIDFSLPSIPQTSPAIAPSVSITSDFGAISSYLCPSALCPSPVQHPRSLTQ